MTKEELKQEAEKHADGIYHYKINVSDYGEDGIINYRYSDVEEAYLAGAEPREKRIAELEKENAELRTRVRELEQQIEKMKNCKNCKKLKKEKDGLLFCTVGSFYTNAFGKNCDKWEIKEND